MMMTKGKMIIMIRYNIYGDGDLHMYVDILRMFIFVINMTANL